MSTKTIMLETETTFATREEVKNIKKKLKEMEKVKNARVHKTENSMLWFF